MKRKNSDLPFGSAEWEFLGRKIGKSKDDLLREFDLLGKRMGKNFEREVLESPVFTKKKKEKKQD